MLAAQHVDEVGVCRHDVELAGFDLRQVEHVVEQGHQRLAAIENGLHLFALFGGEVAHLQHLRHAEDAVERRADLVAHVGEEGGLGVGGGDCGGLRLLQFLLALAQLGDVDRDGDLAAFGHRAVGDLHIAAIGRALFVCLAIASEGAELLDLFVDLSLRGFRHHGADVVRQRFGIGARTLGERFVEMREALLGSAVVEDRHAVGVEDRDAVGQVLDCFHEDGIDVFQNSRRHGRFCPQPGWLLPVRNRFMEKLSAVPFPVRPAPFPQVSLRPFVRYYP